MIGENQNERGTDGERYREPLTTEESLQLFGCDSGYVVGFDRVNRRPITIDEVFFVRDPCGDQYG